jgi:hypothetical protein
VSTECNNFAVKKDQQKREREETLQNPLGEGSWKRRQILWHMTYI